MHDQDTVPFIAARQVSDGLFENLGVLVACRRILDLFSGEMARHG